MSKFQHLVITGTSGVGKSYLEEKLEETGLFSPLPKVTDRLRRPGEDPQKLISITTENFEEKNKQGEFFFTLDYVGTHYGWLKSDLQGNIHKTLAITLKALAPFLEQNQSFLPVLLTVSPENFNLLKTRMEKRGEPAEKIAQRLILAEKEYQEINFYEDVVKKYQGLTFKIKNDTTIPEIIIPEILKIFNI